MAIPNESSFFSLFDSVRDCEMSDTWTIYGAQQMTDWALEKLYQLITHRHDRVLPTVITSQFIIWEGADNSQWNRVRGQAAMGIDPFATQRFKRGDRTTHGSARLPQPWRVKRPTLPNRR